MKSKLTKGLLIGGMIILPFPLSGILLLIYVGLKEKNNTQEILKDIEND